MLMDFKNVEVSLAKELQKRKFGGKAKRVQDVRICKESKDVQQLLSRIKHAYMNKARAAQMHEKQVRQIMEIRQEAEMDEMILQSREHEKITQERRIADQRDEMIKTKHVLFDQMYEKRKQVDEAREEYLLEKVQVNNIVNRLKAEDNAKYEDDQRKQKQCFQDMLESLQDKRDKIQREKDREDEENRLYLIHLGKQQKRQKMFAQMQAEVEAAKEKIFVKLKAEQEERERKTNEWEKLQEELYREILEKKAREQARIELLKKQQQKETMRQASIQATKMRKRVLAEQKQQKLEFQRIMNEEFAKDIRSEQMNAEKRKRKLLEHRKEIERLWQEKLQQFQAEKEQEMLAHRQLQEEEKYRLQIVQEEKERLLREHMPFIEDFMPKAMLEPINFTKIADKLQIGANR